MKIIITIIIGFTFYSCKKSNTNNIEELNTQNNNEIVSMNSVSNDYDSLTFNLINRGDTAAYKILFYNFMELDKKSRVDSILYYSKIMAYKFDFKGAYFDYIDALLVKNNISIGTNSYFNIDISRMDKTSKNEFNKCLNIMINKKIITKKAPSSP